MDEVSPPAIDIEQQMGGGEDVPSLLVLGCQTQTYQPHRSMLDRRHNLRALEVKQRQAFLWFVRGNVVRCLGETAASAKAATALHSLHPL